MKKNIILLVAMSLTLSGCGIYTKYEPATVVPDDLYGGEVVTEDTAGLGNMDWRELFTDPYFCLLYTSPSPRDRQKSRMPSSA